MHVLPCRVCGRPIQVPAKYARARSAIHPHCQPMKPNTYFLIGLALAMLTSAVAIAYGTNRKSSDLPPTPVSLNHQGHADGSHTAI